MKKIFPFIIVAFLLSACGSSTSTPTATTKSPQNTISVETIASSTEAPKATQTSTPTAETIPAPLVFDLTGFQKFAITHSYFQGFLDFLDERQYTQFEASLTPDGSMIAIAACWGSITNTWACQTEKSGFLVVYDVDSGTLLHEIPLGKGWPGNVVFSPDQKTLYYSTHERKVASWDLVENTPGVTFYNQFIKGPNHYPDLAVAPDGSVLAAVVETSLYIWDTSGNLLQQFQSDQGRNDASLNFSRDGSVLTAYSPGSTGLDVYDTSTWTLLQNISQPGITDSSVSPDGRTVVTVGGSYSDVTIWDVASGEPLAILNPGLRVYSIAFNPAGDLLVMTGLANLETPDDYSVIGLVYETSSWAQVSKLYSFIGYGPIQFAENGSRMAIFSEGLSTIWEPPDEELNAGYEVVKQFQAALAGGDYAAAAALFQVDLSDTEYLAEIGVDPADLPGSFETLCTQQTIFCYPVKELVLMGKDWYDMAYLVRLEQSSGEVFTSPQGAQVIYLYVIQNSEGEYKVYFLPMDI